MGVLNHQDEVFEELRRSYLQNPPRCTGCHPPQPQTMIGWKSNGNGTYYIDFKCFACGAPVRANITVGLNDQATVTFG